LSFFANIFLWTSMADDVVEMMSCDARAFTSLTISHGIDISDSGITTRVQFPNDSEVIRYSAKWQHKHNTTSTDALKSDPREKPISDDVAKKEDSPL
ncbi:hypothetical protein KCU81_g79, partial [Aureobasidium melanogenum]